MVTTATRTVRGPKKRQYAEINTRLEKETEELIANDGIDEVEGMDLGLPGGIQEDIHPSKLDGIETLNALPVNKNGILYPEFWRYYLPPFGRSLLYDGADRYNDLIKIMWGPRGGGKTCTGVTFSIIDGMMRGIPTVSNVPISWIAKDHKNKLYKIESIPFNVEAFADGDSTLRFKRLLIDEGNYLADRLRSTSNKNLAMTDILQQARKFRMCVDFCTINWAWLDARVTGSLLDVKIECNDLFYNHAFRRKNNLKKGNRISWDIWDMSGKCSGHVSWDKPWIHTTFNAWLFWSTYDTEKFVDNKEARRKLHSEEKMIVNEFGNEVKKSDWLNGVTAKLKSLVNSGLTKWKSNDLWDSLAIDDDGLRKIAGRFMRHQLGIDKTQSGNGGSVYDLSGLND